MATANGNSTVAIVKNNHKAVEIQERVRPHPTTINRSRVRQVHDGANKMNFNAAGCMQGRYEETSNCLRSLLIEVCRKKEHPTSLAQLAAHLCSYRVGAGSGGAPVCKGGRSDPKPDQQVADEGFAKVQTQANCDEELPKIHSDEASAVRRERSGVRNTPMPEGRLDNANENQFQEVGRDVAWQ